MKLRSSEGASLPKLCAACLVPLVALVPAATGDDAPLRLVVFSLLVLVLFLWRADGTGAAFVELDSRMIAASFVGRPRERIPLERIAAVTVQRRLDLTRGLSVKSSTSITIFRADEPGVIQIRAWTPEADAFLFALARHAKHLGLSGVAPFAIPRRHCVYELLPLVPAIGLLCAFPSRVSWLAFALAVAVFVAWSALSWWRLAMLAEVLAAGKIPRAAKKWAELLHLA